MTAATTVKPQPQYIPNHLELPLSLEYHHKTWHTTRDCPQLLAVKIGTKPAMFIAQLHYWLDQKDVGIYKQGWHWIYNTEWQWLEQLPCFKTEDTVGRVRRFCERRGYVVSNNFNQNPLNRTKYSTLDYYLIALETGWNPLELDLNRSYPRPPGFKKGEHLRRRHLNDAISLVYFSDELVAEIPSPEQSLEGAQFNDSANLQNTFLNFESLHSENFQDDLYSYNSYISTKDGKITKKKGRKNNQEEVESNSTNVNGQTENGNKTLSSEYQRDSVEAKIPPPCRVVKKINQAEQKVNTEENSTQSEDSAIPTRQLYDWEIAWKDGEAVIAPDFIRWRAKNHYEPQGGQWASAARGHAAAEIARKTRENSEVATWMWQDFLDYAEKSADNALAHAESGMEPGLPQAFTEETRDTETVAAKLVEAKGLVEEAKVAKLEAAKQEALPSASQTEEEKFWEKTRQALERYQIYWRSYQGKPDLKRLLDKVIDWVQKTLGLIMTDSGPALDPDYVFVPTPETDETREDNDPDDDLDNNSPGGNIRPTPPPTPNDGGGGCAEDDNDHQTSHPALNRSPREPVSCPAPAPIPSMSAIGAVLNPVVPLESSVEDYEIVEADSVSNDPWSDEFDAELGESVEQRVESAISRNPATTLVTESQPIALSKLTVNNPQGIKVGDKVDWEDCPGSLEQLAPFEVIDVAGELAYLDLIEKPIPLSQLIRRDTNLTKSSQEEHTGTSSGISCSSQAPDVQEDAMPEPASGISASVREYR